MTIETRSQNSRFDLYQYLGELKVASYSGEYRIMSERMDGYRGPRRQTTNECLHQRVRYQPLFATFENKLGTGTIERLGGMFPVAVPNGVPGAPSDSRACVYSSSLLVGVAPSDMEELTRQMCGDVQPIVSVPNMILELPQALSLWHDLKDPLMKALKIARKSKRGSVLRRLKDGSNALLAQQFGLLPLVGDLTALLSLSKKVHSEVKRITTLPAKWEKSTKKCSSSSASWSRTLSGGSFGSYGFVSDSETRDVQIVVHYRHKKAREISVGPELYQGLVNQLTGMNDPLSVLWEATPFSFVADWFYPIGDRLKQLSGSTFSGLLLCKDICTVVKAVCTVPIDLRWQSGQRQVVGVLTDKYFRRYIGLPPVTSSWSEISMPGIRQGTLAGALLLQSIKV